MNEQDNYAQAIARAKASLHETGQTIKEWSEARNINPRTTYAVLNGQKKCRYGEAHKVAVLLGIKKGFISEPQPTQAA